MKGRVLIAAGSDSGGGAGRQADIKAVTALGGYAATAITALTAQNTRGVFGVQGVAPEFIQQQMRVVLEDIGADAIKTGMLHTAEVIAAVCDVIEEADEDMALVADPVMVATSGDALLDAGAEKTLAERLIPLATVLTPNVPEAERLSGLAIANTDDMRRAGDKLLALGPDAVLLKGGHLKGGSVIDLLITPESVETFASPRIETRHTHGTGCTLASAIAAGLAQGLPLSDAVARARDYLHEAIRTAPGFGAGHGPVNHGHTVREFP